MTNKNKLRGLLLSMVLPLASIAAAANDQPGLPTNPHELIARLAGMPDEQLQTLAGVSTELILEALAIEVNEAFAGTLRTPRDAHVFLVTMFGFHAAATKAAALNAAGAAAARAAALDAAWVAVLDATGSTGSAAWATTRAAINPATAGRRADEMGVVKKVTLLYFLREARRVFRITHEAALGEIPAEVTGRPFERPEDWLAFRIRHFRGLRPEAMAYLYPFLRVLDERLLPLGARIQTLPGVAQRNIDDFRALPPEQQRNIAGILNPRRPGEGQGVPSLQALAARQVRRDDADVIPQTLFPTLLQAHPYWVTTLLGILLTRAKGT